MPRADGFFPASFDFSRQVADFHLKWLEDTHPPNGIR
jgi:hypothetical protein